MFKNYVIFKVAVITQASRTPKSGDPFVVSYIHLMMVHKEGTETFAV
jgi:hypothetical protein